MCGRTVKFGLHVVWFFLLRGCQVLVLACLFRFPIFQALKAVLLKPACLGPVEGTDEEGFCNSPENSGGRVSVRYHFEDHPVEIYMSSSISIFEECYYG